MHGSRCAVDSVIYTPIVRADSTYGTFYKVCHCRCRSLTVYHQPCESALHKRMISYLERDKDLRRSAETREREASASSDSS